MTDVSEHDSGEILIMFDWSRTIKIDRDSLVKALAESHNFDFRLLVRDVGRHADDGETG